MRWGGAAVVLAALLAACSDKSGGKATTTVPYVEPRVVTAGESMLALVPEGADAVLELDLGRLRANATVGPSLRAWASTLRAQAPTGALSIDPLLEADVVVAAAYGVAGAAPVTLWLVRGADLDAAAVVAASADTAVVDEHTLVFGAPEARAAVLAAASGERESIAADDGFLALRARAMPARAPGAAIRLTARLSLDARIDAAGRLGIDELPATVSLWLDVADDLAAVAYLGADDGAGAQRLTSNLQFASRRASEHPTARRLLRKLRITPSGPDVHIVLTIGPAALGTVLGN